MRLCGAFPRSSREGGGECIISMGWFGIQRESAGHAIRRYVCDCPLRFVKVPGKGGRANVLFSPGVRVECGGIIQLFWLRPTAFAPSHEWLRVSSFVEVQVRSTVFFSPGISAECTFVSSIKPLGLGTALLWLDRNTFPGPQHIMFALSHQ